MDRQFGVVREIKFDSWGFIKVGGQDVFFNHDSVYGEKPKVGDYVLLSKFVGGGAPRAHPVFKLRK